jgi:hypothetical protein
MRWNITVPLKDETLEFSREYLGSKEHKADAEAQGIDTFRWSLASPDYGFSSWNRYDEGKLYIHSVEDHDCERINDPEAAAQFIERLLAFEASDEIVMLQSGGEVFIISREGTHEFPGPKEWIERVTRAIEDERTLLALEGDTEAHHDRPCEGCPWASEGCDYFDDPSACALIRGV